MEKLGVHRVGNPAVAKIVAVIHARANIARESLHPSEALSAETENVRETMREQGRVAVLSSGMRRPKIADTN